jgi:hypothetical protein
MPTTLEEMEKRVANLERRLTEIEARLELLSKHAGAADARLDLISNKVDALPRAMAEAVSESEKRLLAAIEKLQK